MCYCLVYVDFFSRNEWRAARQPRPRTQASPRAEGRDDASRRRDRSAPRSLALRVGPAGKAGSRMGAGQGQGLRFLSLPRGANAQTGEAFALRETPLCILSIYLSKVETKQSYNIPVLDRGWRSRGRVEGGGGQVCRRAGRA